MEYKEHLRKRHVNGNEKKIKKLKKKRAKT